MGNSGYRAVVSSDWSECLSPNGPFDPIAFSYPALTEDLSSVFRDYTGNKISLAEAVGRIRRLVPDLLSRDQVDAYLDASFRTYSGVPDLIEWCHGKGVLFMINTTGTQAYFQRALARGLLPDVPVVAANPFLSFGDSGTAPRYRYEVLEIADKPKNTDAVIQSLGLRPDKLAIMGDSGGDGPHFEWGARSGAFLVGCMAKPSLVDYCRMREIAINRFFGPKYAKGETRDPKRELAINFMDLTDVLQDVLGLTS